MYLDFSYTNTILPTEQHSQVVLVTLVFQDKVSPVQVRQVRNCIFRLFESVLYPCTEPHLQVMCFPSLFDPRKLFLTLVLSHNEAAQIHVQSGQGTYKSVEECLSQIR